MVTPPAPLLLYMDGLREHDLDKIRRSFAPELRFVTPLRSMDAEQTLRFLGALYAGFPDWHYDNDPPVLVSDGRWGVKWRQGGTHTGKLALPGFVEVEATNRVVAIPEHYFYYTVDETGLKEIRPDPVPGGAPHGIFKQIGVEIPRFRRRPRNSGADRQAACRRPRRSRASPERTPRNSARLSRSRQRNA